MANPVLHEKVTNGGLTLTGNRKNLDPELVLPRAQAEALGKDFWLPVVQEKQNNSTSAFVVEEVGEFEIQADRVYRLTVVRDKTQAEKDADTQLQSQIEMNRVRDLNTLERAQFEMIFELANRVRVLEGEAPYTKQQFTNYVAGKLNA
jgi:hypothetical protein